MKTYFVVNPKSSNGDTGRRWAEYQAKVSQVLPGAGYGFTAGPMDAARLAREALKGGYQCVVAVGGDGTINEVTNGFFAGDEPLDPNAVLGVLPRGTGGDFRKTFGWETDLESNLARLGRGESKPFDVGFLEYTAHDGSKATRLFANICSVGISGDIDALVNKSSKALGSLSFSIAGARALLSHSDAAVKVRFDGGPPEQLDITVLAVANGKYFGGGMKVAPQADPHDGKFHITIWSGFGIKDFALKQGALRDGRHVEMAGTRTLTAREVELECARTVLIDCDGEQPGRLPCRMRMLPGAIRVNV